MDKLEFALLSNLPQSTFFKKLATQLWLRDDVIALWLGGSFASGKADRYSDVDLRVAVPHDALADWTGALLDDLFDGLSLFTKTSMSKVGSADESASLHHLLLSNGDVYDVWVQTSEYKPHREPKLVLGCRDAAFRRILDQPGVEERLLFDPADPATIRTALEQYWSDHIKNQKVLYRGLDLIIRDGMYLFSGLLLRLQFVLATGNDCGNVTFPPLTIHAITPVVQTLQGRYGDEIFSVIGLPTRTRHENIVALEKLSDAIAHVGRQVAEQLDFDYPTELEAMVLQSWQAFKAREFPTR